MIFYEPFSFGLLSKVPAVTEVDHGPTLRVLNGYQNLQNGTPAKHQGKTKTHNLMSCDGFIPMKFGWYLYLMFSTSAPVAIKYHLRYGSRCISGGIGRDRFRGIEISFVIVLKVSWAGIHTAARICSGTARLVGEEESGGRKISYTPEKTPRRSVAEKLG